MDSSFIAIAALYCAGGWLCASAIINMRRSHRAQHWSSCYGRIIESGTEIISETEDHISTRPLIRYEYRIDGTTYKSQHCWFGQSISIPALNNSLLKRFSQGKQVIVYYNPRRPEESVLLRGVTLHSTLLLIISIALITMATFSINDFPK